MSAPGTSRQPDSLGLILQGLWRSFRAPLLVKDSIGRLSACNDAFLGLSRKTESELLGKKPSEYWDAGDGLVFERYDAIVRQRLRSYVTREIFGRTMRFTARWPVMPACWYGSLSVYRLEEAERIRQRMFVGRLQTTPPEVSLCRLFFETCPWAISVRDTQDDCFVYTNEALRRLFTPPNEEIRNEEFFSGCHPRDCCPEKYWREQESGIVNQANVETDSETIATHPYFTGVKRRVLCFCFAEEGMRVFRATLGFNTTQLEALKSRLSTAKYVEPIEIVGGPYC